MKHMLINIGYETRLIIERDWMTYTTIGPVRPGYEPIFNLIKRNNFCLEYKQKKEEI